MEGVDVLIFLGRIFRVLHSAVGPMPKPLRVLFHIRMIGGALKRDIECDLNSSLGRRGDKGTEVVERSKVRMNCLVSALNRTDCPGTSHVVEFAPFRVVFAFAEGLADG